MRNTRLISWLALWSIGFTVATVLMGLENTELRAQVAELEKIGRPHWDSLDWHHSVGELFVREEDEGHEWKEQEGYFLGGDVRFADAHNRTMLLFSISGGQIHVWNTETGENITDTLEPKDLVLFRMLAILAMSK